jgi:hypothetical protein
MTETQIPQPEVEKDMFRTPGFAWRVGLSIAVVFGWLAFLIIWLFFYAAEFDVFQNIAIFLVSVLVGVGILAAAWATWGIRYAKSIGKEPPIEKPRWTTVVNVIAGVGWLIFLVVWLFYYASEYSGYQNLAIFIASLLVLGAVTGSASALKWLRIRTR